MAGFLKRPKRRGPAAGLTPPVLKKVQAMLDTEQSILKIA